MLKQGGIRVKSIFKSFGYVLFYMMFQMVFMSVIAIILQAVDSSLDMEAFMGRHTMLLACASNILTVLALILLFRIRKKSLLREINLKPVKPKSYILPCIAAFTCSMVFSLFTYSMSFNNAAGISSGVEYYSGILPGLGGVIQAVTLLIVSPVTEEIIFRGLILTALQKRFHWVIAVLVSGLLFGLIHFMAGGTVLVLGATVMGIVLGVSFVKTKSILPAIMGHVAANMADFAIAVLPPLDNMARYILMLAFAAVFAVALLMLIKDKGSACPVQ